MHKLLRRRAKRQHRRAIDGLPDGSVLTLADEPGSAFAVRGPALLHWTSGGYIAAHARPRNLMVNVLTPAGHLGRAGERLSTTLAPERGCAVALVVEPQQVVPG